MIRRRLLATGLLAAAIWLSPPLSAQAPGIGVEFGYTRAGFTGQGSAGVTLREGALAGAYLQVGLASWLALRPGLQLASKGGATTILPADSTVPLRFELDLVYLDLPVVLRARIPAVAGSRLILLGGGAAGIRIGCNVQFSRSGVPRTRSICANAAGASFRSFDMSLLAGAGIGIPLEGSELALEVRYSEGLRSVSDLADLRNRSLSFLVSIPF
jgi:Outer membrane protein beta-barrel domain